MWEPRPVRDGETPQFDDKELLAARNIERVTVSEASQINAWDLVRYDNVIISERGFSTILSRIVGGSN